MRWNEKNARRNRFQCVLFQQWSNVNPKNYLLVVGVEVNAVSVVDVDGPPVLVLQRGPHHEVSEAVVVEVRSSCQCVTKPGILGLFFRFQGAVGDKHLLLVDKPEKDIMALHEINKCRLLLPQGDNKRHGCSPQ